MITYYSPGASHPASGALATKAPEAPPAQSAKTEAAAKAPAQTASAEKGTGTAAKSGLGQGDITIALAKVFPPPKPDLSSLPRGTRGDVILDAVIDEQGVIGKVTLVQGLGPAIDDVVIATVRGWTYTPAMRNGQPVPSEQEFLFHYERSWQALRTKRNPPLLSFRSEAEESAVVSSNDPVFKGPATL